MRNNDYELNDDHVKCQCLTFDESGKILGSCDSLFSTSKLSASTINRKFPFLARIISFLKDNSNRTEPLFFPQVELECNNYHSICDFTFMISKDALGVKRIIWMIYDNSIHFHHLIKNNTTPKVKISSLNF